MRKRLLTALILTLLTPPFAAAQSGQIRTGDPAWTARPKFEVIASAAMAHVFRFEDQGFGNHFNFGVGVELPVWQKLRLGAEVNKTFGLSPTPAKCGAILSGTGQPLPCVGTARQGVSSATAGSLAAAYYFGEGQLQIYLVGGLSFLSAKEYATTSIVHNDFVEFREFSDSNTGIGPTLGAGLRACFSPRLSIRPEIRFSDGTSLSSINLSQWRISVGVAYGW